MLAWLPVRSIFSILANRLLFEAGEVDGAADRVEVDRVDARAAVEVERQRAADHDGVVAGAALEAVGAAVADQRVVALAADEGLGRRGAGEACRPPPCRRTPRRRGNPRRRSRCSRPRRSWRCRPHRPIRAPTIRSSKPSPLTSPADDTERPDWSSASAPKMRKPWAAVSVARSMSAKPEALPKITIALARVDLGVAGRIGPWSPDDQVVEAVAVDVAGRRHRIARPVACVGAEDAEALGRRQRRQIDVGKARGLAEDHDSSRPRRSSRCRTHRPSEPRRSGRRSRRR